MFLLGILILVIVVIIIWNKVIVKYDLEPLGTFVIIVTALFYLIASVSYSISLDTISSMESFYNTNRFVYEEAIKEFPNSGKILTKNDSTVITTLPYEVVKLVANYNTKLTWYNRYQNQWFIGGFISKVPKDLKYISPKTLQ